MYRVHQVVIFPNHHKSWAGSGSEKEQQLCPPSATSCLFSPLCWPRHLWWAALGNWAGVELTWQRNVFVIARGRRRRPEQGPGCWREAELWLLAALPACSTLQRYSLGPLKFEGFSTHLSFPIQEEIQEMGIFIAYGQIKLVHWLFKKK